MLLRRRLTGGYLDQGLVVSGHYDQILDIGSFTLFTLFSLFSPLKMKYFLHCPTKHELNENCISTSFCPPAIPQ